LPFADGRFANVVIDMTARDAVAARVPAAEFDRRLLKSIAHLKKLHKSAVWLKVTDIITVQPGWCCITPPRMLLLLLVVVVLVSPLVACGSTWLPSP